CLAFCRAAMATLLCRVPCWRLCRSAPLPAGTHAGAFLKVSSEGLLFLAPLPLVTTVAPPPSSTSVRCWCLYFIDALLVVGDTISNAGRRHYRPSLLWGFLPLKGVGWQYAAFECAP